MKNIILAILCLFTTISQADFIEAQKYYNNSEFTQAFAEFSKLAKLGNKKSQYNLAVMLSKGQGTEKDLVKAYAWAKIVSDIEKYKPLNLFIEQGLSTPGLSKAEELYNQYYSQYAYKNSKVLLGPVVELQDKTSNIKRERTLIFDKKVPPRYPLSMARAGAQGWVKIMFYAYPDGSIRDIQIVEELPVGAFGKSAIESIEKYKFHFEKDGEIIKPEEPYAAMQRIDYKLYGRPSGFTNKQKRYLSKLEDKAVNGDVFSQYEYAAIEDRYFLDSEVDKKKMNQWLFNASQEGIADAQYLLGKNIYYGKACKIEKQKGLDWIMHAAQVGNSYAQYMAYRMLQNKKVINQSNQPAFYWLAQAAKNGLSIAQLHFAKEISKKDKPLDAEVKLAKKYIKNYAKETYKTIQWYQISALIEDKSKNYSKALSKIKSAMRLAKAYDWDLTELEQQKAMIKQHKS